MAWIYLSPHLDDAILSCGGLIHKQVHSQVIVEVWTIFAGDPPEGRISSYAVEQHNRWKPNENYPELRRAEDILACQQIGARHRHLPFQDCIYRQSKNGRWLYDTESAIFGNISRDDESTIEIIRTFLRTALKPSDHVVLPLAIGNHVDHQITRKAMKHIDQQIHFYADIPYVIQQTNNLAKETQKMKSDIHDLSKSNLANWENSILHYASQIKTLFGDEGKMCEFITNYYNHSNGFYLWRPEPVS